MANGADTICQRQPFIVIVLNNPTAHPFCTHIADLSQFPQTFEITSTCSIVFVPRPFNVYHPNECSWLNS